MQTIDYEKYSNMNQKQLLNSLINAEKQEQKIKKQMQEKQKLIYFLKTKMKESLDTSKNEFFTQEQAGLDKIALEVQNQISIKEQEQLRKEVQEEINRDYSDEL